MGSKRNISKRIVAGILSLMMCLSMLPQAAYAAEFTDAVVALEKETTVEDEFVTDFNEEESVGLSEEQVESVEMNADELVSDESTSVENQTEEDSEILSDESEEELELAATSGKCGDNLTYYLTGTQENRLLVINGYGPMYDYPSEGAPWNNCRALIKNVSLPEGLESIGDNAFADLYYVKSVTIPATVKRIGIDSFHSMYGLVSISIPASVTEISDWAFSGCDALSMIKFESNSQLKIIGKNAFEDCIFSSFVIPSGVTEIGAEAFTNCSKLKSIVIPNSVKVLGGEAFGFCSALTTVKFESGIALKRIPAQCFNGANNLASVNIPEGVEYIGAASFRDNKCTSFTIPEGVKYIGQSAFAGTKCTSFTIPDSVIQIDEGAFADYDDTGIIVRTNKTWKKENGENFDWSDPSEQWDCKVFADDATYNKCGDNITWSYDSDNCKLTITGFGPMYDYAEWGEPWAYFKYKIKELEFVNEGAGITHIGTHAFSEIQITSITIPDSVESIGDYAFCNCQEATSLNLGSGVKYIGEYAFTSLAGTQYKNPTGEIVIPAQVEHIGELAFHGNCFKKLIFETKDGKSNLKTISRMAFDATSLDEIILAEGLESIEYAAFRQSNITELTLPSTVKFLGVDCFEYCSKLTSVTLNEGLEIIAHRALSSAPKLTSITIPSTVYQIGECALGGARYNISDKNIKSIIDGRGEWKTFEGSPYTLSTETWSTPEQDIYRSSVKQKIYDDKNTDPNRQSGPALNKLVISDNKKALNKDEEFTLSITEPEEIDGMSISFVSSNEAVASLERTALGSARITAGDYGYATIIVTAKSGSVTKTATCEIKVVPELENITVGETNIILREGKKVTVPVNIEPAVCARMCDFAVEVTDLEDTVLEKDIVSVQNDIATSGNICLDAVGTGNVKVKITEAASGKSVTMTVQSIDNKIELNYGVEIEFPYIDISPATREIEAIYGEPLSELADAPYLSSRIFKGWNTSKDDKSGMWVDRNTILNDTLIAAMGDEWKLYAKYDANIDFNETGVLNVSSVGDYEYTGKVIKPEVRVYDATQLLKVGKDYKVTYGRNNTNAYTLREGDEGFDATKAPCVIVTGIGNYSGTIKTYFVIRPKDISEDDVVLDTKNMLKKETAKAQALTPIIKWEKTTLSANKGKDYVIKEAGEVVSQISKQAVGKYPITLEGRGNYTGVINTTCEILAKDTDLASSFAINLKAKKFQYTGKPIEAEITAVKCKGITLKAGLDYTVSYSDNILPGTATVTVTGTGSKYVGSKAVTYTITGTPITKTTVDWGFNSKPSDLTLKYTGVAVTHAEQSVTEENLDGMPLKVYIKATKTEPEKGLTQGVDYKLVYSNNVNVGKGTVSIIGMGEYSGSKKVNFSITGQDISTVENLHVGIDDTLYTYGEVVERAREVAYMQGATTASTMLLVQNLYLREGIDYTATFYNNKKVATNNLEKNAKGKYTGPYITFKGKGNFSGSIDIPFSIVKQDISSLANISALDVAYANKANNYISKITVVDTNGKPLKLKTDYTVKLYEGESVDESKELIASDKKTLTAGSKVTVLIEANPDGSYKESMTITYRILESAKDLKNIAKANIVILPQTIKLFYPVEITSEEQFDSVKTYYKIDRDNVDYLELDTDFEVVGYKNNVNKGTATVYLKGVGDYCGTKTVTFKINALEMR